MHFALVDQAQLVRVQVLDRVLDRHDVLARLGVDFVDDRRERRGFAGAGGAGHQHQTPLEVCDVGDHRGQTELVEAEDAKRNGAEGSAHRAPLHVDVGAEASQVLHAEGKVELVLFLELDLLLLGEHGVAELLGFDRRERRHFERHERAVDTQLWGRAGGDVEVRRALVDHGTQQLVQVDTRRFS